MTDSNTNDTPAEITAALTKIAAGITRSKWYPTGPSAREAFVVVSGREIRFGFKRQSGRTRSMEKVLAYCDALDLGCEPMVKESTKMDMWRTSGPDGSSFSYVNAGFTLYTADEWTDMETYRQGQARRDAFQAYTAAVARLRPFMTAASGNELKAYEIFVKDGIVDDADETNAADETAEETADEAQADDPAYVESARTAMELLEAEAAAA